MAYNLGVDLGTTFVAAAIAHPDQVKMFSLGDHSMVAPAVVFLPEEGELITGDAAGRRAASHPDRGVRELKRRLGDPTPVKLGDATRPVTTLLGSLLGDVLGKATSVYGAPPERVVLTHPANWGPFRRSLFEEVPRAAGLADVTLVTEPEAAGVHYASAHRLEDGEIVAVYDLGGGTFDATILRKQPHGVEIVGSPEGIERLGGIDFDEAISSYVNYAGDGALDELDRRDPRTAVALARLRHDCALAKEALSVDTETTLPVFLPDRNFVVTLTRAAFEDMVRAQIESTIGALLRALRSAGIAPADLSTVLLVGGSSRIPLVSRMVSEELGRPTVVGAHPKYAVALGAAAIAGPPPANGSTGPHPAPVPAGTPRPGAGPGGPAPAGRPAPGPPAPPSGPPGGVAPGTPPPAGPHHGPGAPAPSPGTAPAGGGRGGARAWVFFLGVVLVVMLLTYVGLRLFQ